MSSPVAYADPASVVVDLQAIPEAVLPRDAATAASSVESCL